MANDNTESGKIAFLSLGSNVGDRAENLKKAVNALAGHARIEVLAVSGIYESAAHTKSDAEAPPFLNLVSEILTDLNPFELLSFCLEIERQGGRLREQESHDWPPRTIDVDIILYDRETIDTPELRIPHPLLAERRFVLTPLHDIAPGLRVPPPFDRSLSDLLRECPDTGAVTKIGEYAGPVADEERNQV